MNNGKVLMIVHDRYQEDNFINLGLSYIGAVLLQNNVEVEVYDQAIYHYTNEQLAKYLDNNSYDLILVSFLAGRYKQTVEPLLEVIDQHKKNAWIIGGGHGCAPCSEYMLNNSKLNIVCTGEGEYTVLDILNCKLYGKSLYDVKGIAFKDHDKVIINKHRKPVDVNTLPLPAWDLFDVKVYSNNLQFPGMVEGDHAFPIISGRGCTNRCSFCYRMEKGVRVRKVSDVVNEMKILNERFGINYFFFCDELFVTSLKRVKEFADELKKNNLNIMFSVNARVDIFSRKIAQTLKDSGCLFLNVGFESCSDTTLQIMGKNATVKQNIETAEICYDIGLPLGLNFLFGFSGDTIETLWKNVDFIKKYNSYSQCRTLRDPCPYPGSPLLTEAVNRGFIKHEDEFFDKFKNSDLRMFDYCGIPDDVFYSELLKANTELVLDHYKNTNNDMETAWKIINGYKDLYEGKTIEFYGSRSDATNADKRKIIK